jgi:phosphomannomutase/phosphoglucomutase
MFVDETGTVQMGDRSLALIEDEVLKKNPGARVVTPVNSSMAISEIARKRRGKLIQTEVGSIHVARTMISKKAILGGEENGGIFYAPHHPVRDGTMATILILNAIVENRMPLSKLMARLPRYYMAKEKFRCKDSAKKRAIAKLKKRLGRRVTSDLDGVKVELKDRGWFLVRASGTEPLIRMTAEGKTESDLRSILNEFKPLVTQSLK